MVRWLLTAHRRTDFTGLPVFSPIVSRACAIIAPAGITRRPAAAHIFTAMDCRPGCAACCIAPSISSAIPGMPQGKPAGLPCVQLDEAGRCRLFGQATRPAVCASLRPSTAMCGDDRTHALLFLRRLEDATNPARG